MTYGNGLWCEQDHHTPRNEKEHYDPKWEAWSLRRTGCATHTPDHPERSKREKHKSTIRWVCAVNPTIYDKILGRVYNGMSRWKVVEFLDYNQCLTYVLTAKVNTRRLWNQLRVKNSRMIRFTQVNINGRHIVGEQLRNYSALHDTDILLVQEPPMVNDQNLVYGFNHGRVRSVLKNGTPHHPTGAAIIIPYPRVSVITSTIQNANVASIVTNPWIILCSLVIILVIIFDVIC